MGLLAGIVALLVGAAVLLGFDFDYIKAIAVALVVIGVAFIVEGAGPLLRR